MLIGTPDHWHALTMIEAVESGVRCLCAEANQRGHHWKARRCWLPRASTTALCRWARNGAARRIWWRRETRILKEGKLGKIAPGGNLLLLPHARDGESAGYGSPA